MSSSLKTQDLSALYEMLNSTASVLATSKDGSIVYANDNFCRLMGYTLDEIMGKNPRIFNSGVHEPEYFKELWTTLISGKPWKGAVCNRKKDGTLVWMDTLITPVFNDAKVIEKFIVVRFDITNEKQTEMLAKEQSLQLENQKLQMLIQNSKMAALNDLSAGISHEINNPLGIIIGKTEISRSLYEKETSKNPKIMVGFSKVESAAGRIHEIVKSLRAFAQGYLTAGPDQFSIEELTADISNFFSARMKAHNIEFKFSTPQVSAMGTKPQMIECLISLIQNSMDAIKEQPEKWIHIECVPGPDNTLEIRVTDSGQGIPLEIQDRIMNPFFTTKPQGEGKGLGLSVAKGTIESFGGTLSLNREAPHTQFVIGLKKAPETPD